MQIANRTLFITGGASGLGAACARRFAAAGANVMVADLNRELGAALAAESPGSVAFVETDVTDEAGTASALEAAVDRFGEVAGVVHCAGIVAGSRILGREGPHDLDLFSRVVRINLVGSFNVLRLAAPVIAQRPPGDDGERGVIVLTSSVAAFEGQIGQAAYAASKGGVAALTLPAARELAALGIRVVSIVPGIFDTPLMAGLPEAVRESLARQPAFPKRLGQADEFAALAQHIFENPMLNGAVLRLDGGLRMAAK